MQPSDDARWCEKHNRLECVHPRKNNRGPCHAPALTGGNCCRMHVGEKSAPVVAEAKLNKQAARELARIGTEPVSNAFEQLAVVAGEAVAWKNAMAEKVNDLLEMRYEDAKGAEQLRSEIVVWERALDRCVTTLAAMAKLNIDDRLAGIRQQTLDMLERALDAALESSGAGLEGKQRAREAFRRNIRVVA